MIKITGDIHNSIDAKRLSGKNWVDGRTFEGFLIIAGDFGFPWDMSKEDEYWVKWLSEKKWTTLFVDGNHENFDILDALPTVQKFGADVGQLTNKIFHLRRGRVYTIEDKKIFTFGGGLSIDKYLRKPGVSWWEREMPSDEEIILAWENIEKHKEVDYVITHVPPDHMMAQYLLKFNLSKLGTDFLSCHLRDMSMSLSFKTWYHGHLHIDDQIAPRYVSLFKKIINLGDELR